MHHGLFGHILRDQFIVHKPPNTHNTEIIGTQPQTFF